MRDGIADQRWCCVLFWVAHAVPRACDRVRAIADFPKDCFGETPKRARGMRALPNRLSRGFNQRCNCAFLREFLPMRRAIYPGSFDPVTNGHLDVIERARTLFDEVIVAVAINDQKQPLFTPDERLAMLRQAITIDAVRVAPMDGLLVEFAASEGAHAVVRGLRAISDFEFEFQMALMNRKLDPEIETIFLMPKEEYTYLSSRIVKEIARLGGDVSAFVPSLVAEALAKKFNPELGNVAAVI
jgi:pantetheine-phosphate adenylyltransferase